MNQSSKNISRHLRDMNGADRIEKNGKVIPSMEDQLSYLISKIVDSPEQHFETFSKTLNLNLNGGLQRGKVYTIVAPAGGGKTTFALQLMEEVARKERIPCVYVAMEQGKDELLIKSMSRLTLQNSGHIEGRYFQNQVFEDSHHLAERVIEMMVGTYRLEYAPWIYIIAGSDGTSVSHIRISVQRIRHQHQEEWRRRRGDQDEDEELPPALLCIDPFQRLSSGNSGIDGDRFYRVDVVASQIKQLARDLSIPVVVLSDTTKSAVGKAEGGKSSGQAGIRGSYLATHTTDVQAELRLGGEKLLKGLIKEAGEYKRKYERIGVCYPLSKYPDTAFPSYACLDLSKQRSGSKMKAMFVYLQAYNKFIPIEEWTPKVSERG